MDPLVVFDCNRVVPNRFALTLAAAGRTRCLNRGEPPRVECGAAGTLETALHEIAAGALAPGEIQDLLPGWQPPDLLPAADEPRGGQASNEGAAVAASHHEDTVH